MTRARYELPSPTEAGVSDKEFVKVLAPMVGAIRQLAVAHAGMNERFAYQPAADSKAMAELADERPLAAWGWSEPVLNAHVLAGIYATAGFDHLRSYAHLFISPPIPLYSQLVIARAALEAFAWAVWVGEAGLSVETRVQRAQLLRLSDGKERTRFPAREMKRRGRKIIKSVKGGVPHGWKVTDEKEKPLQIGRECLPSIRTVIRQVMPSAEGSAGRRIDSGLWSVLCGTAHANQYALMMAMEEVRQDSALGPRLAGLSISAQTVNLVGALLLRAAVTSGAAMYRLFGWDRDPQWRAAVGGAQTFVTALVKAA